ncbi:MAG: hypothetical protein ACLT5P_08215 [Flavonifractor plautii]
MEEVEAAVLAQRLQEDRTLSEIAATLGIDLSTVARSKVQPAKAVQPWKIKPMRESCHKIQGCPPGEMGFGGAAKPFPLEAGTSVTSFGFG